LDPLAKGQIAKNLLFFFHLDPNTLWQKGNRKTDSKRKQQKICSFFSIWTQTPYGKKEKRGLNKLLPKLLPFGSNIPNGKNFAILPFCTLDPNTALVGLGNGDPLEMVLPSATSKFCY
jgi:hypothetical protein